MSDRAIEWLPVRRLERPASQPRHDLSLEWLVTNGLGGYASGPIGGGLTRRFHGILIAALPAPLGRMLYCTHLRTSVRLTNRHVLVDHEDVRQLAGPDVATIAHFDSTPGLPRWTFAAPGVVLERWIFLSHRRNTAHVLFRPIEIEPGATLRLEPALAVRPHEGALSVQTVSRPDVSVFPNGFEMTFSPELPPLRGLVHGPATAIALSGSARSDVEYSIEESRGYDYQESLLLPGCIELPLTKDQWVGLSLSTESWPALTAIGGLAALERETARLSALVGPIGDRANSVVRELTLAADQFLILPASRAEEVAEGRLQGEEPRTVIAGYHWFTDWGRDTMISLEGLTLETGREREAQGILRTFAGHVRDGLIPNLFPEGEHEGLYHTADATLWFFHAADRYVSRTQDETIRAELLPVLVDILEHHLRGTRFGIRVDPADGLLTQGARHYQLTWMDAKVGDWVVTPRRGKAVEINALWYNALHIAADWLTHTGRTTEADRYLAAAARAAESFNRRFWNDRLGHLYDVVDGEQGDDPACRPNQVLAISLPHPVLDHARWTSVLDVVERTLLTPVGLRSLAPGHPDYKPKYFGDLRARDAAYHQGTVWAWLIGPFVDAWLKVHPGQETEARTFLNGLARHFATEACAGSVSEIFDAESPFAPRGCIAQAWSVAELLRVWKKTGG